MKKSILWTSVGALAAAGTVYGACLRPRHLRWGATEEELEEALPGDDLTPHPKFRNTHAITIDAPAADVWPWLMQIGQNKGGFYSYSWLENLLGCQMKNADEIIPEFQDVAVGDRVWLHPKAPPLPVVLVDPGRALVFGSNSDEPGTWGLYLKPIDDSSTRLIARGRGGYWNPGLSGRILYFTFWEPAHFVMERKMMLTIKHLAERAHVKGATHANPRIVWGSRAASGVRQDRAHTQQVIAGPERGV